MNYDRGLKSQLSDVENKTRQFYHKKLILLYIVSHLRRFVDDSNLRWSAFYGFSCIFNVYSNSVRIYF